MHAKSPLVAALAALAGLAGTAQASDSWPAGQAPRDSGSVTRSLDYAQSYESVPPPVFHAPQAAPAYHHTPVLHHAVPATTYAAPVAYVQAAPVYHYHWNRYPSRGYFPVDTSSAGWPAGQAPRGYAPTTSLSTYAVPVPVPMPVAVPQTVQYAQVPAYTRPVGTWVQSSAAMPCQHTNCFAMPPVQRVMPAHNYAARAYAPAYVPAQPNVWSEPLYYLPDGFRTTATYSAYAP